MLASSAPSGPPSPPRDEWAAFLPGTVVRCPGYNRSTSRVCVAAMGFVPPAIRIRVRVRAAAIDKSTMLIPRCRRCHNEVEIIAKPWP